MEIDYFWLPVGRSSPSGASENATCPTICPLASTAVMLSTAFSLHKEEEEEGGGGGGGVGEEKKKKKQKRRGRKEEEEEKKEKEKKRRRKIRREPGNA